MTLAPEAGSEKIRHIINKGIEEEHLFKSISMGINAGVKNYRLYIMVGLPNEDENDIKAIVDMTIRLKQYMEKLGSKRNFNLEYQSIYRQTMHTISMECYGRFKTNGKIF